MDVSVEKGYKESIRSSAQEALKKGWSLIMTTAKQRTTATNTLFTTASPADPPSIFQLRTFILANLISSEDLNLGILYSMNHYRKMRRMDFRSQVSFLHLSVTAYLTV